MPGMSPVSVLSLRLPCLLVHQMCGVCRGANVHSPARGSSWLESLMSDPLPPLAPPPTGEIRGVSDRHSQTSRQSL